MALAPRSCASDDTGQYRRRSGYQGSSVTHIAASTLDPFLEPPET